MKILLTGGGTGGHVYPLIAVAQSIRKIVREEKLLDATLYYMAPSKYNEQALLENGIIYVPCFAGKIRRYFSLLNVVDLFKTATGIIRAIFDIYNIFPDIIFSKGGYVSFPALVAARLFGIPVVIHESDSKPGRVSLWSGKFAKRIALSYPQAAQYFDEKRVAHTGNPIRKEIELPLKEGSFEHFQFERELPVLLILGGSQGSQKINDIIIDILPELVEKYNIIHQTGKNLFAEVKNTSEVVLNGSAHKDRYKAFAYLDTLSMRMAAGCASLIISRAGSTIFEIAEWGIPSIIIPIPEEISHDQRSNAFAYASTGACSVIEEVNLTPHIVSNEIDRIISTPSVFERMKQGTETFRHPHAADTIAREIINIALTHTN